MQSKQVLLDSRELMESRVWLENAGWTYKLALPFLFGCILALSSPGLEISWLVWLSLAPLLVLIRGAGSLPMAALTGLAYGIGYHAIALSWYLGLAPLSWLGVHEIIGTQLAALIWLLETMHQAFLIMIFAVLVYALPVRPGFLPHFRRPFFPQLLAVPALWIFFQWIIATSELYVGLPINQLAYTQYKHLSIIQLASLGGSGALDFLILLVNTALANVILEFTHLARKLAPRPDRIESRTGSLFDLLIVSIILVGALVWGDWKVTNQRYKTSIPSAIARNPQTPPVTVGVVQGNVSIEEERLNITKSEEIAERYQELASNLGASILFLPEAVLKSNQMEKGYLLSRLTNIAINQKKEILVGSIETLENGFANAVRLISPFEPQENLYIKQRLVPLGEAAPTGILNRKIPAPLRERIPATRESFLSAHKTHLLQSGFGKIGVSIYIELIYPRLIAEEVRQGASLLVNTSNLAWFHNAFINRQLLAAGVLRAVENERYLVIANNTGISAVIDPSGMIVSKSLPGHRGILLDTIQFLYEKSPYSRMWWF